MTRVKDQYLGAEAEMTGAIREQAAQAPANYFEAVLQYRGGAYDAWTTKDTENKEWKLMSDGSVHTE